MRLWPSMATLVALSTRLVSILFGFPVDRARCPGLLMLTPSAMFPRPRMTLAMLLCMLVMSSNLRSMPLTRMSATVLFRSDDTSMWCSVPLRARLKFCLSGLVMIAVICLVPVFGWTLSRVGPTSLV